MTVYSFALVCVQAVISIYVLVDLTLILSRKSSELCNSQLVVLVIILAAVFGVSLVANVVLTMRIRFELVHNI